MAEIEQRLGSLERRLDHLKQEIGSLALSRRPVEQEPMKPRQPVSPAP